MKNKNTVKKYKRFLKSFKGGMYTNLNEATRDYEINNNAATAAVDLKLVKKTFAGVYKLRRKKISKLDAEILLERTNEITQRKY